MRYPLWKRSLFICFIILIVYLAIGVVILYGDQWKKAAQSIFTEIQSMIVFEKERFFAKAFKSKDTTQPQSLPPLNRVLSPVYEIDAFLDGKMKKMNATIPFEIKSITTKNKSVPYTRSGRTLMIENPNQESELVELQIKYSVPIPRQGTRFGIKDNVWLLTNWYPQLAVLSREGIWMFPPVPKGYGDPFYYQYGNYTVHLVSPSSFQWVSSGEWVGEETKGENVIRTTWEVSGVLGFALVGSPHYQVRTIDIGGGTKVDIALVDQSKMGKCRN